MIDKRIYSKEYINDVRDSQKCDPINTKFNAETAFRQAAKVMHLSSCIINCQSVKKEISEESLLMGIYSKLNQTRKVDKKAFNMMAYSIRLFEKQ